MKFSDSSSEAYSDLVTDSVTVSVIDSVTDVLSESNQRLHSRALAVAERYRQCEADLMDALIEIDQAKVYLSLGYPSVFQYAVGGLKLSEAVAYNAIAVARKATRVPFLREVVRAGSLSLSKARKVLPVLDRGTPVEEQQTWIEAAVQLSSRKLERAVAIARPQNSIAERATYKSRGRIELTFGVAESLLLDFRQAQNLVCASRGKAVSLEETLAVIVADYLERKDPQRRSRRVVARKGFGQFGPLGDSAAEPVAGQVEPTCTSNSVHSQKETRLTFRTPISASVAHGVRLRDGGRCQAIQPNGEICGSQRWLDFHHRIPVHQGGMNSEENLITLCRGHHRVEHRAPQLGLAGRSN